MSAHDPLFTIRMPECGVMDANERAWETFPPPPATLMDQWLGKPLQRPALWNKDGAYPPSPEFDPLTLAYNACIAGGFDLAKIERQSISERLGPGIIALKIPDAPDLSYVNSHDQDWKNRFRRHDLPEMNTTFYNLNLLRVEKVEGDLMEVRVTPFPSEIFLEMENYDPATPDKPLSVLGWIKTSDNGRNGLWFHERFTPHQPNAHAELMASPVSEKIALLIAESYTHSLAQGARTDHMVSTGKSSYLSFINYNFDSSFDRLTRPLSELRAQDENEPWLSLAERRKAAELIWNPPPSTEAPEENPVPI